MVSSSLAALTTPKSYLLLPSILLLHGVSKATSDRLILVVSYLLSSDLILLVAILGFHSVAKSTAYWLVLVVLRRLLAELVMALTSVFVLHCISQCTPNWSVLRTLVNWLLLRSWFSLKRISKSWLLLHLLRCRLSGRLILRSLVLRLLVLRSWGLVLGSLVLRCLLSEVLRLWGLILHLSLLLLLLVARSRRFVVV